MMARHKPLKSLGLNALAIGLSLMLAAGCKDLLVYENFKQIHEDAATHAEVARLIGDPDARLGNHWMYERPAKHLSAYIDFDESGRVCRKQWVDGINNVWEDSDETGGRGSTH